MVLMDKVARLELELKRLADAHTTIYLELLDAKAQQMRITPAQIKRAAAKARGNIVELPTDPTARAIVLAARKARSE